MILEILENLFYFVIKSRLPGTCMCQWKRESLIRLIDAVSVLGAIALGQAEGKNEIIEIEGQCEELSEDMMEDLFAYFAQAL